MLENSRFRRICGNNTDYAPIRDGLGILRFSQFFCTAVITAILPLWLQLTRGQTKLKNWTFNAEKPPKRRFFEESWSERQDSNLRHPAPKPMSEPSCRPLAPSLALSGTPTVSLCNSFALFASGTAFGFWDLCGMEFCILKVLPTGFAPASDDSVAENASEIAPHKQWNKPRLGSCL